MNESSNIQNNLKTWRIITFGVIVGLIIVIYLGRLFAIQILQHSSWLAKADDNRTTEINLPAPRGIIYDRNGTILARNIASYNVVITPASLPDDTGETQRIFQELSTLIGVPVNGGQLSSDNPYVPCLSNHGIAQIVEYGDTTAPYSPVKIKCDVNPSIALVVNEKAVDWPGVSIETEPVRDYPTGYLTADLVGYLGPISADNEQIYRNLGFVPNRDKIGYAGVEREYQTILAGKNGLRVVEWDAAGEILRDLKEPRQPTAGQNIRLTIDTRLQQAATSILTDEITSWNKYFGEIRMTSGVAIAMNPQTGEILAMVSYPTYENNRLARIIPEYYYKQLTADATKPLLNHAVGDELPVGSVFKLSTATGALNEGVVTPDQVIKTPGILYITEHYSANDPGNQRKFVDWNWQQGGFGQLDFLHGLANSSNVYFYKLGGGYQNEVPQGLGICRLGAYARALGYGDYPGTGLPEEAQGNIPDPVAKRLNLGESWTLGDTYISSVGQGYVLGTPLQVLMSASTIANNGKLMTPTLLHDVLDGQGNVIQPFQPKMRWDLTKDNVITAYEPDPGITGCVDTGQKKNVQPWVFKEIQQGMRMVVTEGTLSDKNRIAFDKLDIAVAGKTGTAEYCDQVASQKNRCIPGNWPTHAWTIAYAPYENPEIAVVVFVYNGGEGATTAAPIVRRIMQAYFSLKAIDNANAAVAP